MIQKPHIALPKLSNRANQKKAGFRRKRTRTQQQQFFRYCDLVSKFKCWITWNRLMSEPVLARGEVRATILRPLKESTATKNLGQCHVHVVGAVAVNMIHVISWNLNLCSCPAWLWHIPAQARIMGWIYSWKINWDFCQLRTWRWVVITADPLAWLSKTSVRNA